MKNHLKHTVLPALLCASVLLSGCGAKNISSDDSAAASEKAASPVALDVVQAIQTDALFSDRDLNQSYDAAAAVTISLNGNSASCASDAVSIDGGTITILDEGVYLLSGTLIDGQVIVNADDADKVQIVLNHADITSASSAAIYCLNADKVFLTLAEGTENALANGGSFTAIDDNNIDAVVFSKTDLTLNGTGSLTVTSPAGHGVVSKDELTVTGGIYTVTAAGHGFTGKDSVAVAGGSFDITAGKDGIHADAAVVIRAGDFSIPDCYEGIEGQSVTIEDGTVNINACDDGINAAGGADGSGAARGFGKQDSFSADESCFITINGGTITIVSDGDSIDSNGSLTVNGGTLELTCNGNGNTAIDTNGAYTNNGGSVTTNDGSESGAGGKGGSMLRGSGKSGKSETRPDSASQTPDANASA